MSVVDIVPSSDRIRVEERLHRTNYHEDLAQDVRNGLTRPQKALPPRYFYDEHGSRLFERICELPEYYQTRTERGILERIAPELSGRYRPAVLVEFGSGSSAKSRVLLSAMQKEGSLRQYVPIDVSREILVGTAEQLVEEYPGLEVSAVIGDFNDGLPGLAAYSPRLIIFLGGTIGNLRREEAVTFLRNVADGMQPDDLFLLGVDLVKNAAELNAAYNDSQGVTAAFNLNVLTVINRELEGEFPTGDFSHYAFYNPGEQQIEMHLVSLKQQTVPIKGLDLMIPFERGETILTEISRKFSPRSVEALLESGGMHLVEFHTDSEERFALCLARKAGE